MVSGLDLWVVEYSPIQKMVHVATLAEMLSTNLNLCARGVSTGYIPVAIAQTQAEAVEAARQITTALLQPTAIEQAIVG